MAFSTFRGMMAASKTGSGPVGLTDTYTPEALSSIYYYSQSSYAQQAWGFSMNNSGSYLIAYMCGYNGGTVLVDILNGGTNNKSYCTVANINGGVLLSLGTTSGYSALTGDSFVNYTAGTYGVVYRTSSTAATFAYLTTSGSTVSVNNNSSAISLTNLYTLACKGFPSQGYAWVLATNTSGTGGIIKVWNYGSGSQQATLSLTSSNININSGYIRMCALTNVLAFACYTVNSSYGVQLVGIDFNGSSTITWNTTVSSGVTVNANSGANCWAINSTTAGLSYFKSGNTTQMFFRTVTVGAGGSITLNTEYSTTVAVANAPYYAPFDPVNYTGSNWATAYIGADYNVYVVQFSISGNVFTFGTKQYPINNSNAGSVNNNFLTGQLVAMDSTHIGAVYEDQSSNGRYAVGNVLDVNSAPTWTSSGPIFSSNNFLAYAIYSGYSNYNSAIWIGANRFMFFGQTSSNNSPQIWTQDVGFNNGNGPIPQYSSQVSLSSTGSGSSTLLPLFCNLNYDYTDGNPRILMATVNNSSSAYFTPINPGLQGSSPVVGSSTTVTAYATTNGYSLTNIGTDVSLFLYNGQGGPYSNQIAGCVVLTSGNTISSVGSQAQVVSTANVQNIGGGFYSVTRINNTQALLVYSTYTSPAHTYGVSAVVLSISGTTITAGTPVSLASGYASYSAILAGTVFTGGTTGVFAYTDSAKSLIYVNGFTLSGSTITVGTQATAVTYSGATVMNQSYSTYNPPIVPLNATQALLWTNGYQGSGTTFLTFTYNSINSITTYNQTTNSAGTPNIPTAIIPTDNSNNYLGFLNSPSGSCTMNLLYRA